MFEKSLSVSCYSSSLINHFSYTFHIFIEFLLCVGNIVSGHEGRKTSSIIDIMVTCL